MSSTRPRLTDRLTSQAGALAERVSGGQRRDQRVPIDLIDVVEDFNSRTGFVVAPESEPEVRELVESIRENGVLVPVILRPRGERYELVAGHRRLLAATLAGLRDIPFVLRDAEGLKLLEINIIENAQRKNLDIIQETQSGFKYLAMLTGKSEAELPAYLHQLLNGTAPDEFDVAGTLRRLYGNSLAVWAQQRRKVLLMTPAEKRAVQQGRVVAKVAYELVALPEGENRGALLERAAQEGLSAAEVKRLVTALLRPEPVELGPDLKSLAGRLRRIRQLRGAEAERARALIAELIQLTEKV